MKCPVCGLPWDNEIGVRVHLGRVHGQRMPTERNQEVLRLLDEGLTQRAVARRLGMRPNRVQEIVERYRPQSIRRRPKWS